MLTMLDFIERHFVSKVLKWTDTDLYSNSSFISLMKIQNMEVKFSCETNMVPEPSIVWMKNGKLFNGRAMGKVGINLKS